MQIERVALERAQWHQLQYILVRGLEHDLGRPARLDADQVPPPLSTARGTAAVAEKTGQRGVTAGEQGPAKDVFFRGGSGAHGPNSNAGWRRTICRNQPAARIGPGARARRPGGTRLL